MRKKTPNLIASVLLFSILSSTFSTLPVLANELTATVGSSETEVRREESSPSSDVPSQTETAATSDSQASSEDNSATDQTVTSDQSSSSSTESSSSSTDSSEKPGESDTTPTEEATTSSESSTTTASSTTNATSESPSQAESVSSSHLSDETGTSETTASTMNTSVPVYTAVSEDQLNPRNSLASTVTYVEHWSGTNAYTHNLLSHRYGITAEQLDSFLDATGISYNKERINGKLLLKWEAQGGLDVRALVAIAISESALGTKGVATKAGANMFGYGAIESNPNNATNYSDELAATKLVTDTIIANKNETFKIQDDKALKNAKRGLNTFVEGGVYFTDTSGAGLRRAAIMEKLDQWIDSHGGTPAIPTNLQQPMTPSLSGDLTSYSTSVVAPINTGNYITTTYPWGECTWYVFNRARELGYRFDPYMGNGADWQTKAGYDTTHTPAVGYAVSFLPGQAGADPTYGHVAIVEGVKEDGSVLISESNGLGRGVVSYRTFTASQASQLTYVIGKK